MSELAAGVAARMLRPVVAGLISQGVAPEPVLAKVGLDAALLLDHEARVPHAVALAFWDEATETSGDRDFGLHAAEAIDFRLFDVQAHAVLASADVRAGISTACRYQRLQHDAAQLHFDEREGKLSHVLPAGRSLPRQPTEFVLATWILLLRQATGAPIVPRGVSVNHSRPERIEEHLRLFGVEPRFGADERSMTFFAADLQRPFLKADSALYAVLVRHAQDLLSRLPRVSTIAEQARALVARELASGNPSLERVAEQLHMSARTLNRRLLDEGTSHRALLEQVREELARRYLADARMGIREVAFLLGFSEPSAFHRAFKRWTGTTPAAFRESGRGSR